jgi:hypothetical protein
MPGFPSGFKFAFEDEPEPKKKLRCRNISRSEALSRLRILHPNGEQLAYHDLRPNCTDVTEDMLQSFCSYVGVVRHKEDVYDLLGKGYRQEWTNLAGINELVFGKVLSCTTKFDGGSPKEVFTVVFQDWAKSGSSFYLGDDSSAYVKTKEIPFQSTLGGVISYERDLLKQCHTTTENTSFTPVNCTGTPFQCWRTPEKRKVEFMVCQDGVIRPKLTMLFRGWRLEFFVKQSTIKNAGLGCFVQCTSLLGSMVTKFDIQLGELLDIGVYAPLRDEDKKTTTVFKLKNYVHSYAPEEWVFGSVDGSIDVSVCLTFLFPVFLSSIPFPSLLYYN